MMGIVQGEIGEIMEGVKMKTLVEKIEGRWRRNMILRWVDIGVEEIGMRETIGDLITEMEALITSK